MFRIIDYQAKQPISIVNNNKPIPIPLSPKVLATIDITIPRKDAHNNHVELIATVGVRGENDSGTSQILFKIFRDGKEIYRAQEGVESDPTSEVNYIVTIQAIDKNLGQGSHFYKLTAENIINGPQAAVVGPISFSGLAVAAVKKDCDNRHHRTYHS